MAYNPNRDSGQVLQRGFIEIPKDKIPSGLIEEYDFVPSPTQRYFAQLVYNVGSGTGGGSDFTAADREKFDKLVSYLPYMDLMIAATGIKMETLDVTMEFPNDNTLSITDTEKIIPVQLVEGTNEYSILKDSEDIDNDPKTEYLLNVLGYVSAVECYVWIDKDQQLCSERTERFLPKITFDSPTEEYPYGKSTIYFSQFDFEDISELPAGKNIVRIHYLKLPVQAQNNKQ